MKRLVGLSVLLACLAGTAPAVAEVRLNLDLGNVAGSAHDVSAEGGMSTLSPQQTFFGFLLRTGITTSHVDAGLMILDAGALVGPSTLALGLYAGPSFVPVPRLRISLAGEIGEQIHSDLGDEFGFANASSSDPTLPYAGATATIWLNGRSRGAATVSFGLYAEARFDLGHTTGQATVTPDPASLCLISLLGCLLAGGGESMPQSFTQSYAVGGHEVYFGVLMRVGGSLESTPQPKDAD